MTSRTHLTNLNQNTVSFRVQWNRVARVFILLVYLLSLFGGGSVAAVRASTNMMTLADVTTLTFQHGVSGYTGTVDTFLRGTTEGNTNFSTNTNLEWDDNSGTTTDEVTLMRFTNLFTAEGGPIPNGATITSASLTYVVTNLNSGSTANGDPANVYESLVNWTGSTVTYNNFGGEAGVQADEYNATLIASAPATALSTPYTINVTASLQRWSNGTPNYGWIFLPSATDGVNLYSSDHATLANRPRLSVTYTTDPVNQAPAQPLLIQPANGATGVSTLPNLSVTVSDPDSNPLNVTFYGRRIGGLPPGPDFTIIAMPDTQHYVDGVGDPATFAAQTQWIVDNKAARNIVFVTGLGDIVQNGNASDSEWQIANNAYSLIEDPLTTLLADGIPYGLAVGNHDQSPIGGGSSASTTKYNQYFGISRFDGRVYYGGHHGSDNDNNYELFSASGMDFIIIHFEYDTTPEQSVLDWADTLLTTYSNRRAILTTHFMINQGNPASWGAQGQALYNALSDHPNLFMMLGGHIHGEGQRQDTGVNGNVVTTLLSDYQDLPNGGNGYLRIMKFSPANNIITVSTYSPTLSLYGTSTVMGFDTTSADFILPYNMDNSEPFVELGTVTGVTSGSNASMNWSGLQGNAEYEWYAAVSDGNSTTSSSIWNFSTGGVSPTNTSTPTATSTPVNTATPTRTHTATFTPTNTATPTATNLPTVTNTVTSTPTHTATPLPTNTPTVTNTATPSPNGSDLIYLSSAGSGTAGGVTFADEDILLHNKASGVWSLYFDGSDVGLSATDVDALALMPDNSILLSPDTALSIGSLGTVDDSDIVRFIPTSLGDNTAGTFEWYFDGSDVGLTTTGEDIDTLDFAPDGRLVIGLLDTFSVTGASGGDEDLLAFSPTSLGSTTSGTWTMYFDGSDVGLADTVNEDLGGVWINGSSGQIYLSTLGAFSVTGAAGDGADIFICTPGTLGSTTTCIYGPGLYWDGSVNGFAGQVVDGLDVTLSTGPTATPTLTLTPTNTATRTPTLTVTNTPTRTNTPTFTLTNTSTLTPTSTSTSTATFTGTAIVTSTATNTLTNTPLSPTFTSTSPSTSTPTFTPMPPSPTFTSAATFTSTPTRTNTPTATATVPTGFPSLGVLDNFNRPNGAPGTNWGGITSGYGVVSNRLDIGTGGAMLWQSTSFGANQEVFVTMATVDSAGFYQDLLLKSQSATTWESGVIDISYDAAGRRVKVWTFSNAQGWVQRGTDLAVTFANGDQFGARVKSDGTVEVYLNGVLIGSRNASAWTYSASGGYIGLLFQDSGSAVLDDFGGGTTAP